MAYLASQIESDVAAVINRQDQATLITLAVRSAHRKLQGMRDWNAQKLTYRRIANVHYNFAYPAGLKSPRQLFKVTGTDLASDLIPSIPPTSPINESPFYQRSSMEQVLAQRAIIQAQFVNQITASLILTQNLYYAVEGPNIEIVPALDDPADQIALTYYGILDYPGANDWFTDNGFGWLLFEALKWMLAALGETDPRETSWEKMQTMAFNQLIGDDIALDIGGDALVMRG